MSNILVVDDVKSELNLLAAYLTEAGHSVETASNGQEALDKVSQRRPDAIITDWVMPQMGGIDICRRLKRDPKTALIPIIACTAKNKDVDRLWARKQGINAYLTKPCTRDDLLNALTEVMN